MIHKTILLAAILFSVSFVRCGTTERVKVTSDMASYQNDPESEIRNVIFRYLGEGSTIYVNFKAMTYGGFKVLPGYNFQTKEFGDFQNNEIVYHNVTYPFHLFMNYRISVTEGTSPVERICKADIIIRKPGSWKVDIYH